MPQRSPLDHPELYIEFAKTTPTHTNAELDQLQQVADGIDCSIYNFLEL